jgi:hypothetical protein
MDFISDEESLSLLTSESIFVIWEMEIDEEGRNVIWAADTNYRISLPNDVVRYLCEKDDYAALQAADQVSLLGRELWAGTDERG